MVFDCCPKSEFLSDSSGTLTFVPSLSGICNAPQLNEGILMKTVFFVVLFFPLFGSTFGQANSVEKKRRYNICYYQEKQKLTTNETIYLLITGKTWKQSESQSEVIWNYDTKPGTQKDFQNQFSFGWLHSDTTGFIENENKVWIHPPRNNQYTLTETAPFPDVRKNLNAGDSYSSILFVGAGCGVLTGKKINSTYTISNIRKKNEDVIWTIQAISVFDDETNYCKFIYSNKKGFVSVDYKFYNGDKMRLNLTE
jgi:hypothetical protein